MSIEQRLAAAERRIADLERRLGPASSHPVMGPVDPFNWADRAVCPNGCKTNSACMNAACPLRPIVNCTSSTDVRQ
jgi:hypothetical protein